MRRSVGSAAVEASVPNDGAAVEEAARTRRGGREALHLHRDSQGFGGPGFEPGLASKASGTGTAERLL